MPKHRTRKEKETPNYSFLISWKPGDQGKSASAVKGQFKNQARDRKTEAVAAENANLLDKNDTFAHIRRNVAKSLILAGIIIALELVVYLAWK